MTEYPRDRSRYHRKHATRLSESISIEEWVTGLAERRAEFFRFGWVGLKFTAEDGCNRIVWVTPGRVRIDPIALRQEVRRVLYPNLIKAFQGIPLDRIRFWTLTVRGHRDNPMFGLDLLDRAGLLVRRFFDGAWWILEVTYHDDGYHFHIHVLSVLPAKYQPELIPRVRKFWAELTGSSNVDYQRVYNQHGLYHYVSKYLLKPAPHDQRLDDFVVKAAELMVGYDKAMDGRRRIRKFGVLDPRRRRSSVLFCREKGGEGEGGSPPSHASSVRLVHDRTSFPSGFCPHGFELEFDGYELPAWAREGDPG